jgi:putative methyltransferase
MKKSDAIQYLKSGGRQVKEDDLIESVLELPCGTDLHDDDTVASGKLILQDKASCFSAFALDPPENSFVIDACSAPGK